MNKEREALVERLVGAVCVELMADHIHVNPAGIKKVIAEALTAQQEPVAFMFSVREKDGSIRTFAAIDYHAQPQDSGIISKIPLIYGDTYTYRFAKEQK